MKAVPNPRCGRETKHGHAEVQVCLVAGFLVGKTTIRSSLRWCKKHVEELREYLPLKNGIASPSTACRLLSGMDELIDKISIQDLKKGVNKIAEV